jgi:hypothetical protein
LVHSEVAVEAELRGAVCVGYGDLVGGPAEEPAPLRDGVPLEVQDEQRGALGAFVLEGEAVAPSAPASPVTFAVRARAGDDVIGFWQGMVYLEPSRSARETLAAASAIPPRIGYDEGYPTLVWVEIPTRGSDPLERVLGYLRTYRELYGIDDLEGDAAVVSIRESRDDQRIAEASVLIEQRYHGLRVPGGELRVLLRDDAVVMTAGRWLRDPGPLPEEWASATTAQATAWRAFPGRPEGYVGRPRLVYWDPWTARGPAERDALAPAGAAELAWELRVGGDTDESGPTILQFVIGAQSGSVRSVYDTEEREAAPQEVWDFELEDRGWRCEEFASPANLGHPLVCDGSGCASGAAPELTNVQRHTEAFSDHVHTRFGLASFDGSGQVVRSAVRLAADPPWAGFRNGPCNYFGYHTTNAGAALVGHEYGHGIIGATAGLIYETSSGAANEAFAQLWGVSSRALSGVSDPCDVSCAGRDVEPNHYLEACFSSGCGVDGDNGGVHSNRYILQYPGELMALGGTHPDGIMTVEGLGLERAERLWYDTLRLDLRPRSGLVESCFQMTARSWRWAQDGAYGFDDAAYCSVNRACSASGLVSLDPDCGDEYYALLPEMYVYVEPSPPDRDEDGVPDDLDNCPRLAWPSTSDLDGDGQGDACDTDADGDGFYASDPCPLHATASVSDTRPCADDDGDGIPNADDPCPQVATTYDTDGDGLDDRCDDDDDNDGIVDDDDPCPWDAEPETRDSDGDGAGDRCDMCPEDPTYEGWTYLYTSSADIDGDGLANFCDDDADGDGVPDEADNCWRDPNPTQYDGDGNGKGFACDPDEQLLALAPLFEPTYVFDDSLDSVSLPLQFCAGASCDALMGDETITVTFQSSDDVSAAVADASGSIVAWLGPLSVEGGVVVHGATFDPDDRVLVDIGRAEQIAAAGLFDPEDVLDGYYLIIYPGLTVLPYVELSAVLSYLSALTGPVCGNGIADLGELCDGPDRRGVDACGDLGWLGSGAVACNADCDDFLTDACQACTAQSQCENRFGSACLADGSCGYCVTNDDCRPPDLCVPSGLCQLN